MWVCVCFFMFGLMVSLNTLRFFMYKSHRGRVRFVVVVRFQFYILCTILNCCWFGSLKIQTQYCSDNWLCMLTIWSKDVNRKYSSNETFDMKRDISSHIVQFHSKYHRFENTCQNVITIRSLLKKKGLRLQHINSVLEIFLKNRKVDSEKMADTLKTYDTGQLVYLVIIGKMKSKICIQQNIPAARQFPAAEKWTAAGKSAIRQKVLQFSKTSVTKKLMIGM